MDLQRTLLIGAIAVLSFMLLTEWVAFKDDKTATETAQTTRLIANGESGVAELPTATRSPGVRARSLAPSNKPLQRAF